MSRTRKYQIHTLQTNQWYILDNVHVRFNTKYIVPLPLGGCGEVLIVPSVVERKYFTCPSRESNPGRWIYRQTLYHVAVKAGFYRKAVEVCYIPSPVTFSPTKLDFDPEIPGHRESFLMRLGELLPGSRMGYLRWAPLS